MPAKKINADFSNVKDGGNFNKKRIPAGDYLATITKVEDAPAKSDGVDMLLFSIKIDKHPSSVLPYYCKITENQLWKLRNIFIAAGKSVPKKKVSVDPNQIVKKKIGVSIEDAEYNDQDQSEIAGVFPAAELDDSAVPDEDEVDLDDDDEAGDDTSLDDDEAEVEVEEEAEEEVEEEAEEEAEPREGLDRTALKRAIKALDGDAKFRASETDDDLYARLVVLRGADAEDEEEEEEEAPAPAPKRKAPVKKTAAKKKPVDEVTDDELESLDIDDI